MSNNVDTNKLSLSQPKDGKLGMKFYNVSGEAGPPCFKVENARVLFEPSVYNGTGEETRKGIVMEITEDDAKRIEELESWMRIKSGVSPDKWVPCVRKTDGHQIKAKINMRGPNQCEFIGPNGEKDPPESLRGRTATAALLVRGVYMQRQASGLMIDVVAMRYGEATRTKPSYLKLLN
jgi:hypothetical protein